MAEDQQGVPKPLTGVPAELPEWAGRLIDTLVGGCDPSLADRLRSSTTVSPDDWTSVGNILYDEFSTQVHGPDWEPTPYGKDVDNALGQFFLRYPADRD